MAVCQGCEMEIPDSRRGPRRKWCSERCRKVTLYAGECVDCGWPTCGYNGPGRASKRCVDCRREYLHATARWNRETIAAAIQLWADEHGGVPPTATNWKLAPDERFPAGSTVQKVFDGSWREAIIAAGFDAFKSGHYGRDGEQPETLAETVRLYRTGLSLVGVGRAMGVTEHTVWLRLQRVGEPRRGPQDWRKAS